MKAKEKKTALGRFFCMARPEGLLIASMRLALRAAYGCANPLRRICRTRLGVLFTSAELPTQKNRLLAGSFVWRARRDYSSHPCDSPCGQPTAVQIRSGGFVEPDLEFSSRPPNSPHKKTGSWPVLLYGAPGGIRTPDHLVRSQVLYPTELQARNSFKFFRDIGVINRHRQAGGDYIRIIDEIRPLFCLQIKKIIAEP